MKTSMKTGMKTAIATVSLSGTLVEKLQAIAAAKFSGVEIFENDLLSFDGTPADVRRMAADLGLEIITFQPFRDFEGMPEPFRSKNFSRAERKFDLMHELGCDTLLVCSNVSPDAIGGIDRAAADFAELGERARERRIKVGFEALAWGRHINDYRDAWEVVRRADHPNIGLVLDSFHTLVRGTDLKPIRAIPKDKIFLVQVADAPKLEMDYLSWSRHYRCMPGQGDLAVDDFMEAVAATGFDGYVSPEIFSDRFRAGSARSVAIDGQRSLIAVDDKLVRRSGGKSDIPAPAQCGGVEFVEFAMDDETAPDLEKLLAGLGFVKVGQHRTKSVAHWKQGDINIAINTDKDGFAHNHYIVHGPSVCALALRVEDAVATLDRAIALLDTPFRQAVGPGELDVPAVRGLGGSLVYFIDDKSIDSRTGGKKIGLRDIWDIEFETLAGSKDIVPGALTRIDHISQSMPYEEMLSWLLFYTSLLDVTKSLQQAVVDPGGVVQSQVVETRDGLLRLPLNASQSSQTLSSRFLHEMFGSGVQHIALATDDIKAVARKLAAAGVKTLPIPPNYYDDLEARTDLPEDEIASMRENNILFDRDARGEFRQLYTQAMDSGFFFEIVQRDGYAGYGAVNAPIRLTSQRRLARPVGMPRN